MTDRCNLRCSYCMGPEGVPAKSHEEIMRFEQIERFVRVAAGLGIRKVRLTGGDPLVRKHICRLVEMLAQLPGIDELTMTTNGVLLDRYARDLKNAGLDRLNVSLDTLNRERFRQITNRDELPRVLRGIEAARAAGFNNIKLNALAIRGMTEKEVVPLALFARQNELQLRFIEFMPLDEHRRWNSESVLSCEEIIGMLADAIGPLEPVAQASANGPAKEYRFADGIGLIGLISTVTQPFCHRCNRLRLTADGKIRNCLFSKREWDARSLIEEGGSDEQLARLIVDATAAKRKIRGSESGQFVRNHRSMHQIGG